MKNVSVVRRATPFLAILALAGFTLPLAAQSLPSPARSSGQPPRNTAGPGGALGGGGGRGFGGAPGGLNDMQQTAITRLDEAAEDAYEAWRDARSRLQDSTYGLPLNPFTLTQAIDDQAEAELELALTRADGFAALQASAQRLSPEQVATLRQSSANNLPSSAANAPSETVTSAPQSGGVLAVLNPIEGTIGTDEYMARSVTLKDGFKMELLYVVPTTMGSWVPATWDDRGRMIVSAHNSEQMFRLTLPRLGTNDAVQVEPIGMNIGAGHGVVFAFDSLYVSVGEGGRESGVYRVRDTNGDDRYDEVRVLRNLEGTGQHGTHALILAPDGQSIYMINGNAVVPTDYQSSRVPYIWSEDNLVKRAVASGPTAPQAWVAHFGEDGANWELFAMGMRNPVDFAFNKDGELFAYDADMEWDKGHPFYRPTQVNHLISGADMHFRTDAGTRKRPQYDIDSWQTLINIGSGSPTGVVFGTGARFPARYQDAMYISDWSYGNIYAVHPRPDGSTYSATAELFASGQPFGAADVTVGPNDGALYVIIGGNSQSALYRVTYTGNESTVPSAPDTTMADARALRHSLERFHGKVDPAAVAEAWPYLGSEDPGLRYAARTAIEFQDQAQWRERALNETDPRRSMAAIVALARVNGRDEYHRTAETPAPDAALQARMIAALDRIDWNDLEYQEQLDLLRAYSLVFIRQAPPDAATRARLIAKFDPLLPASYREMNYELAEMLIYLEAPSAASKVMGLLRTAPSFSYFPEPSQFLNPLMLARGTPGAATGGNENFAMSQQEDEIQYAHLLRNLKAGWTPELRQEYFEWFAMANDEYEGGNSFKSHLATIRTEAIDALTAPERAQVQEILDRPYVVTGRGGFGGGGGGGAGGAPAGRGGQ